MGDMGEMERLLAEIMWTKRVAGRKRRLEMTSDMQDMMWGEPELSGLF